MTTPNDQDNPFAPSPDELDVEEVKRHAASLGNIAHRHPIRQELWDKMEDMTIEGATLYTFGIDPDAIQLEMESPEDNALDELPKDYPERLRIIKSAVRAGTIQRAPINGNDPGGWDDSTRILKTSLLQWCEENPDSCNPAEAIPAYPQYQPVREVANATKNNIKAEHESTHDPVPLSVIASRFKLDPVNTNNLRKWREYAKNAGRNELKAARTQKGKGKKQSLFDPVKVGEWIINRGLILAENKDVYEILGKTLPPRSAHLKDYFQR